MVTFCKSIIDYHHEDIDTDVIHLSHSNFPFVCVLRSIKSWNSLVVQWLGLHPVTAEGPGFNLWLESKDPISHVVHQKKIYKIFFKNNFYGSIVDLQCCVSAVHHGESVTHVYISTLL